MQPQRQLMAIKQFCADHGISRSFFYKLIAEGRGPRLCKLGARTLISAEAAADWRRGLEQGVAQ
jgi:predicted DNA-binding transcriptional regulator AlpA